MAQQFFSIKNCEFAFECPRDWERLASTANDNERHCASCDKLVYLCLNDEALTHHVQAGHCVAVEDVSKVGSMVIGQVVSGYSALQTKPNTLSVSYWLTPAEQESLRQNLRDANAYFQKAFKK